MVSNDANRYLQNDVSSDTTIGYNLMSSKKLKNSNLIFNLSD